jgi:hypothetical protein
VNGDAAEGAVLDAEAGIGSFCVRRSESAAATTVVLVLRGPNSEVRQYKIVTDPTRNTVSLSGAASGQSKAFATLDDCLAHCAEQPVEESGLIAQPTHCIPFPPGLRANP